VYFPSRGILEKREERRRERKRERENVSALALVTVEEESSQGSCVAFGMASPAILDIFSFSFTFSAVDGTLSFA
jgi:hypothetical protein